MIRCIDPASRTRVVEDQDAILLVEDQNTILVVEGQDMILLDEEQDSGRILARCGRRTDEIDHLTACKYPTWPSELPDFGGSVLFWRTEL